MAEAPTLTPLDELVAYRIGADDTVRLVPLTGPSDGSPSSVFLEIWDPEGAQPDNSHPDSVEVFFFLKGEGVAYSDENSVPVKAGDTLTLPIGSVHHIVNTSTTEKMYSITVMCNDLGSQPEESTLPGFHALVTSGIPVPLDEEDLAAVFAGRARVGA